MKVKTKDSDTMAAGLNEVTTTSTAHEDSSSEPDNLTTSTAQKDSSSDNKSSSSVESGEAVVHSPSNVQTVNAPTSTIQTVYAPTSTVQTANVSTLPVVPVYTRPFKPGTGTGPANNDDARRLIVPNSTLHYNTIDAAIGDGLLGRQPITIENDDVAVVKTKANSQVWVNKLVSAFTIDYLSTPEDTTKSTPAQREWFTRWQKQAHATLVTIINGKDPKHLEKSCWHLLNAVIKAHELGIVDAGGNLAPAKTKCSERVAFIVSILEKYALVRLDVVRAWHVDEIAANPEAFIKRKLVNCWNNANRAEKAKEEKAKKEAEKVAGTKRKAGRSVEEDAESEDEGEIQTPVKPKKVRKSMEQAEEAEVETPVKAKRTRKSTAGATDDKTTSKTTNKASAKHRHTTTTSDSDDQQDSTPTKRSTTRKAKTPFAVNDNDSDAIGDMDEA
jgi:hypothetical protein